MKPTPAYRRILQLLAKDGAMSHQELSAQVDCGGFFGRTITGLEARGLVQHTLERRTLGHESLFTITDAGRAAIVEASRTRLEPRP
jgi:hypothetical protein